jgi:hypothetical protein
MASRTHRHDPWVPKLLRAIQEAIGRELQSEYVALEEPPREITGAISRLEQKTPEEK